jgi:hypothetical protein
MDIEALKHHPSASNLLQNLRKVSFMKSKLVAISVLLVCATSSHAAQLSSRTQLDTLLGGGGTLETFEGLPVEDGGQITFTDGVLNSTSVISGAANRVNPGADYISPTLFLEGNGYYNLNTRTLGDSSAWRGWGITISYTAPVNVFGLDVKAYNGYSTAGTLSVYDTAGSLLGTMDTSSGGFYGWENTAGIGRVVVASSDSYVMLDSHAFGQAAAVPEPESLALALDGLVIIGIAMRRRSC